MDFVSRTWSAHASQIGATTAEKLQSPGTPSAAPPAPPPAAPPAGPGSGDRGGSISPRKASSQHMGGTTQKGPWSHPLHRLQDPPVARS
eukprot:SAG22_NODE_214_length_15003_cov_18.466519_16_plen_89_part_00